MVDVRAGCRVPRKAPTIGMFRAQNCARFWSRPFLTRFNVMCSINAYVEMLYVLIHSIHNFGSG